MNTTTVASLRNKERHIGIDVGKPFLDLYIFELDLHWQEENNPEGIKRLITALRRYKLTRVLVEATGGYMSEVSSKPAQRNHDNWGLSMPHQLPCSF